ncbi:uncharacterized protein LOC133330652 [Musca vetustissima]|uniref:uncharacterized protein LOC133330652 n=1 Tax=Musca vetustissima TaxID=27455 RepID=UPI002AB651E6|nr:uncharacterized protein LOC133330652 [Musca vetustissima]
MLATAWVSIVKNGMSHRARALIDPCSDDSFISERIQRFLNLPTMPIAAEISGLGGECLARCSSIAMLTISSIVNPNFSMEIEALVVPDVTGNVPTHAFSNVSKEHLPNLKFADPEFFRSAPVDLLIGGNLYPVILLSGVEHGILGSLVAQETVFGYIVTGPTNNSASRRITRASHCTRVSIDEQLARFWEIEEIPIKAKVSDEDIHCENIYKNTVKRNSEGRYVVDLPFKEELQAKAAFTSNRFIALSQFLRNEQSMSRKPEFKAMYDSVIQEYLSLGHMELVESIPSNNKPCFYLPHHGVFKPESVTTRLRVVFNGSCPTATGKSLNDWLYVGPVLQKDIISLILQWRLYKFVFNADISKMYRQILINPKHANFQRIVYRPSPDEEIKDYKLKTVTFGLNCAPYLALRTLQQLAQDEEDRFPIGAKILRENMYVDDVLVGTHSIAEAMLAKGQLISILESAGFNLRKWTSNDKEIIKDLPRDHLLNGEFLDFDDKSLAKTLGIRWNAVSDTFYFMADDIKSKHSFTKRRVLSVIARLFDPLGWLAPVLITAKIFMQQLWLDDIKWDDELKTLSLLKWKSFLETYTDINKIEIPRWIKYSPECTLQFHGFCDSSELAYAAVLYARVEIGNIISTNILVSKTKVAPIKKVSLPRLELCGALLLAELVHTFLPQLGMEKHTLCLWSDSTIVLAWLKKPSNTWTTFVANRVAKIQEMVGDNWKHVSTYDNPADLATRGVTPLELKEKDLWWFGPTWLTNDEKDWPSNVHIPDVDLESKISKVHVARSSELESEEKGSEDDGKIDDPERHLKYIHRFTTAVHVFGYIERFIKATLPATKRSYEYESSKLTAVELLAGRKHLIMLSQKIYFPKEYKALSQKKPLDKRSPLLTLTPYLDNDGLIRANGRLGSTLSLSHSERHPFILSPKTIHLEAVSDLSTPAFMAALARFVSRRGCPNKIFSDNGRNFVGAAREIKTNFRKVVSEIKERSIEQYGHQHLEWSFIPASAPHMGGLWEAGVKSCKMHLKKIAGQIHHTYEEFSTILAAIEACLNSRPLTPQSDDIDDLTALTPGHFLIGSALLSPAEPEEFPTKIAMLNRWRKLKLVQQEFCRRWKCDYLKELNKRNKWKNPSPNLQVNDLVVLSQEMGSPNEWRLGRVIKLYPGSDGLVRVVDLKTPSGILRRPVHKLVLLPRSS